MTETKITQADREAAWPHRPAPYQTESDYQRWMVGAYDRTAEIIAAFAEYRIGGGVGPAPGGE